MNSSVKTLCRAAVAAPRALRLSVNQTRSLSTTTPDAANGRDGAVHDPIMDKFWRAETVSPAAPTVKSSAPAASSPATSTFTSRDPPLGTSVFEPAIAPRWSE
ncbi:hypothetical protein N0V84_000176 [Fusarium piperis]|uniref:Uncharacterized protein n=1 Tax=Fusarium piperis TaxID=1435070 RepID=A0A9W9BU56_9HYPO|nr:hypothetical protein N0V84_000176 [Fusarium piperis]